MNPLQRAKSELFEVRERFKTRSTRRRQNRNTQDQIAADVRADTVVEQANKTTLRDKLRRTFSPRRGKLILCSSTAVLGGVTCINLKHLHNVECGFTVPRRFSV